MRYKVWVDNDEEWAADTIDKPDAEMEAHSDVDAALKAREKITGRYYNALKFIVQPLDRMGQALTRIELELRPVALDITSTTIGELRGEPVPAASRASKGGRR